MQPPVEHSNELSGSNVDLHEILAKDKMMPIAIVGMACRMPGEATSPDKLWKLISEQRTAWSEMPKDRMNIDSFYHPDGERSGNVNYPTSTVSRLQ